MAQAQTMAIAQPRERNAVLTILWIGMIAGILDISENIIWNSFRNVTSAMIFRHIASGLIGTSAAVKAGGAVIALGVVIHFCIALTWTAIFYIASGKIPALVKYPVISGLVYGAIIYLVMTYIVLPLTRVPPARRPPTLVSRINAISALLFCIGLTVSLLVRWVRTRSGELADA